MTGIVGPDGGPWAGDTTGAFFFDAKGTTEHGYAVTPIVSYAVASDRAEWPVPALVPDNGLFHPSQVGSPSASDGDVWWLMWEGNPVFNAGRPHPLGILVEGRALGWNASGLEDIIFVVYTFYNITSLDEADYLSAPAPMQPVLVAQAASSTRSTTPPSASRCRRAAIRSPVSTRESAMTSTSLSTPAAIMPASPFRCRWRSPGITSSL
ncbi:MAG: hypothetical protein O7E49_10045 [Gemmatimonadetes bacterium]|nr:hypothetical protein [Gemmatimonadota bacterium]